MIDQNLALSIITSYFPKWSLPYQSIYANASKILYPASSIINTTIQKVEDIYCNRYRDNKLESISTMYMFKKFGDISSIYGSKSVVIKENGEKEEHLGKIQYSHLGDYATSNVFAYPITGVSLEESKYNPLMQEFSIETDGVHLKHVDRVFMEDICLYVSLVDTHEGDLVDTETILYGVNSEGHQITETVYLYNNVATETFNKFRCLVKVSSRLKVNVSSTVDTSVIHSVENFYTSPKRVVLPNGRYAVPKLKRDGVSYLIHDDEGPIDLPIAKCDSPNSARFMFLTSKMDIIMMDENNDIHSMKPSPSIDLVKNINGSLNNNKYVLVHEERTEVGEDIVAEINCAKLIRDENATMIRISVENEGDISYVNANGDLVYTSDSWLTIPAISTTVEITIPCTNSSPYIFRVESDKGSRQHIAMSTLDSSNENFLARLSIIHPVINNTSMYLYNRELYIHVESTDTTDNSILHTTYMLTPFRHYYMDVDMTSIYIPVPNQVEIEVLTDA